MASTESGTVELRDVEKKDLSFFLAHQLDDEASRMAAFTPRDPDAFTEHWTKILADESVHKQTVLFEGEVAGSIVSFLRGEQREVGYWIGREHWGKGIATRALEEFLRQVEERPLYANVAKHNAGSIRVLEKCGFTIVGEDPKFVSSSGLAGESYILRLDA